MRSQAVAATIVFSLVTVAFPSAQASTVNIGEVIDNGDFGTNATPSLTDWSTTGTVNARASTNTINTSTGNAGFNSFFTSAFAVLGDTSGDITSTPASGTSTLSQTFTLSNYLGSDGVTSYDLTISFRTVFDGDDASAGSAASSRDLFSASINPILFSQDSVPLPDCGPSGSPTCADAQIILDPFNSVISLAPGTYTITFTLDEKSAGGAGTTNTAAGVDAVSIIGTAYTSVTVDLTSVGATESVNGAIFQQIDPQSTGSGVIESFVRIQTNDPIEEGYNTDGRPVPFDENNSPVFTHSLTLGDVPIVALDTNGDQVLDTLYREFLLDINEDNAGTDPLLSLDMLRIYVGGISGDLTTTDLNDPDLGDLVYDLDSIEDTWIKLDASLTSGSGSGDMFAYIPNNLFLAYANDDFVTLYSKFGQIEHSSGGFEEWAVRTGLPPPPCELLPDGCPQPPPPVIPEPTSLLLLGSGWLGALGFGVSRKRI